MSSTVHAPELDSPLGWLNTDRPLRLDGELRGQVVVLDFWTYCCINCIHILPDLAYLEHKYAAEPVTFIGVHSAKFTNEASRETIRSAILRYEIQHPVVIDDKMKLWRAYAVRSWPTVAVIDPRGYVVTVAAGEGNRAVLDQAIAQTLAQGRAAQTLAAAPLLLQREANVPAASGLRFPGKVLADPSTQRLYVADSNHNRIVVAELPDAQGRANVLAVIGTAEVGRDDGPAVRATFNHPQGLAVAHGVLYVADTENHLIRRIDLETLEVSTAVGTGEMTNDRAGGGMGTQQGINSPWDIAVEGSTLYVAMAGTHQIWRMDMPVGFARALAGTGRENIVDGPTETAAFAQPSGICTCGGTLYVADSEVSAIRGIDMAAEQVFTVLGEGLFSFGDVDGTHPKAKLQHPLGVTAWGASLLVADSYNHKIKLVDPRARSARTLYGTGRPGTEAPGGAPAFYEPGGLSAAGNRLFVADTNNHRVVEIDLTTHAWREVVFEELSRPGAAGGVSTGAEAGAEAGAESAEPASAALALDRDIDLTLEVSLPSGAHLSAEAPWSVRVRCAGRTLVQQTSRSAAWPLRVRIPAAGRTAEGEWLVTAAFAYCLDGGGVCVPVEKTWRLAVRPGKETAVRLQPPPRQ